MPPNQDDVLKIIRRNRELGMADDAIAEALRISVAHLHRLMLRHGTLEEAMDVGKVFRKVTPTP